MCKEGQVKELIIVRHLRILLCVFAFSVFILNGCGPGYYLADGGYLELAIQEQWLAKAHRYDKSGGIYLHIEGTPFERDFQRGYLTANEIDEFLETIAHIQRFNTGKELDYFVRAAAKLFEGKVDREYFEEIRGIVAGMKRTG